MITIKFASKSEIIEKEPTIRLILILELITAGP